MELGLLERSIMRPPGRRASAARFSEVGGHCQRAASKDQRNRARVPPLYPLTRAHEGRAAMSAVDSALRRFPVPKLAKEKQPAA